MLFSCFQIRYDQYVDLELVFAMKLHISPAEMGEMYFYDIMLLYKKYEAYVKEEQEQQAKQQEEYEQEYGNPMDKYSDVQSQMSKVASNMGSLTPSSITSGFYINR